MATAAATLKGEAIQEQEKLFNFLKKYDLQNYYSKFLQSGVRRLNHLKDVAGDEDSLSEIGLTRVERNRLKTKVKENLSRMGKMMVSSERWNELSGRAVPLGSLSPDKLSYETAVLCL